MSEQRIKEIDKDIENLNEEKSRLIMLRVIAACGREKFNITYGDSGYITVSTLCDGFTAADSDGSIRDILLNALKTVYK